MPATVLVPGRRGPYPTWIVLHGMTRPGRHHEQLRRFVHALAASRAVVVVPEVPEWMELELDPDLTVPTIRGALDLLPSVPEAGSDRAGLVGFSFGSPQAILATADPEVGGELAGAVGFGGYCDLERTVRFQFTGRHEWDGVAHRARPDPYGRWIVGANFLTRIPGYETRGDVTAALMDLAREAGDRQIPANHPKMAERAAERRSHLAPDQAALFDLFTAQGGNGPPDDELEELASDLVRTARSIHPLLDPAGRLGRVEHPVHLLHGRDDPLIPFSEALRLERQLASAPTRCTVTALFAHSKGAGRPAISSLPGEIWSFLTALDGVLGLPE